MKMLDLNCNSIHFYLFLVTLGITFMINVNSSTRLLSNPLQDAGCAMIDCGQGKCKASNTSLLGFDCECNPGWNKIQIGHLLFSPCVIPNCYLGADCNTSVGLGPPAVAPPAPSLDTSESRKKGSAEMLHCSRILYAAIAITLLPLLMFVTSA
ncbi:hypothetical protein L484_019463 [Morus notabilis]|uniref:EGF-like domain-containing protein n=1 Tax=Morus notabilis TaxID=981085 RepID=W9SCY5_9ROSA|nr:hypothetical protein L484_019463 [Morus notabilis]